MSETCETVKVEDDLAPGGYVVINKSDFDPENHTLFKPKKAKAIEPEPDSESESGETEIETPKRRGRK